MSNKKSRVWKLLVYPDSAPEDWKQILEENGQRFVCILHDKDVWSERDEKKNPEHRAGEPKKPHYHVMLFFDGETSFNTVSEVASLIKAPTPQYNLGSASTFMRYMLHLGHPEKYQYPVESLESYNGARIDLVIQDNKELHKKAMEFLRNSDIMYVCDLDDYVCKNEPDWTDYFLGHLNIFSTYLFSKRRKKIDAKEMQKEQISETDISELVAQATESQENEVISKSEKS